MILNDVVTKVTNNIIDRSRQSRKDYLDKVKAAKDIGVARSHLSCGNLAHACAASTESDKASLVDTSQPNIAIVTAYNDMLSAHQPFETFPKLIKETAREFGATAQVAGGVPAMCDGITQGQKGMELSLFSRDVIALSSAVALSHNSYDAAIYLGVCDKIIPGLIIAAATFGHLPAIFLPAGPMPSGLPNDEKAKVRQDFAAGEISREELLEAEMLSYHSPGTCTFYGTANSNQMLMEIMGLHLPGASFINPNTPLRDELTKQGVKRVSEITAQGNQYTPVSEILTERAFVNGLVGLLATGGSTNLIIHIVAMAKAAGIILDLEDFSELSKVVPLMTRIYPNGISDVNHFHEAGGMQFLILDLLEAGLLHNEVRTVVGDGLQLYTKTPEISENGQLEWQPAKKESLNKEILRSSQTEPFQKTGGLALLTGNMGRAVMKTSAVKEELHIIEAPARVFHSQAEVKDAFKNGELNQDVICVVRYQGPKACGMPELHSLMPTLGVLQNRGLKVALVTDGRLSGASGKVPAAIHVSPEAFDGGNIAKVIDGDTLRLDAKSGKLEVLISQEELDKRQVVKADLSGNQNGCGVELFSAFRTKVGNADEGASVFG